MSDAINSGLRQRAKNTAEVLTQCKEFVEVEDGYVLRFPESGSWSDRLDVFVDSWRTSCPQMTFEVFPESEDRALRLEIRGPDGTKEFVEGARYMLSSHLNPAPTFGNKFIMRKSLF